MTTSSNSNDLPPTNKSYIPFPVICALLVVYVSTLLICFVWSRPVLEISRPHDARDKKVKRDKIGDEVARVYVQKKR